MLLQEHVGVERLTQTLARVTPLVHLQPSQTTHGSHETTHSFMVHSIHFRPKLGTNKHFQFWSLIVPIMCCFDGFALKFV